MILLPLGQPENSITIVNHLPEDYSYATYPLKGAAVSCTTWQQNVILVQSVSLGACRLHLYQVHASKNLVLTAKVPEAGAALWCVLKGMAAVYVRGMGLTEFSQGDNVLLYSPPEATHTVRLRKGTYQFVCLTLSQEHLNGMAKENQQLAYFRQHVTANDCRSLMQLTVPAWLARDGVLNQLLTVNYLNTKNLISAHKLADSLLEQYIEHLKEAMSNKNIHDGMVDLGLKVWEFVDANYNLHYSMEKLSSIFDRSRYAIDRAFASLTNQSIKQYTLERCLLRAHELLLHHAASVKCCLNDVEMSYTSFRRHYKRRFGIKPSETRRCSGR